MEKKICKNGQKRASREIHCSACGFECTGSEAFSKWHFRLPAETRRDSAERSNARHDTRDLIATGPGTRLIDESIRTIRRSVVALLRRPISSVLSDKKTFRRAGHICRHLDENPRARSDNVTKCCKIGNFSIDWLPCWLQRGFYYFCLSKRAVADWCTLILCMHAYIYIYRYVCVCVNVRDNEKVLYRPFGK